MNIPFFKYLLPAMLALAVASCGRGGAGRSASTVVTGEFPAGSNCDTIMVGISDGVDMDTIYTFQVKDDKFLFEIPTDVMKLAEVVVTYDGGMGNAFFIPEGDTIVVSLDTRNAAVNCVCVREESLTNDYNQMSESLDSLKWSLFREFNAAEPPEGYTKEQNDSLDFVFTTKMNDMMLAQIHEKGQSHKDDYIGLSCVYNLLSMGLDKEARELLSTMSERIRAREELAPYRK